MAWIKRNLLFAIASAVALLLMGGGGYYLYIEIADEAQVSTDIEAQYSALTELGKDTPQSPNPGSGTNDNVKLAKDYEQTLRATMGKLRPYFQVPPPIPDSPKVGNAEFATQLPNTIVQLTREAPLSSVVLPHDYYFTFQAQRNLMTFDPASLNQLAASLGEIKAISEILYAAKVNYLEGIKRELVTTNNEAPGVDYLTTLKTVSSPLAEMTPYQLTFRCFSSELAAVLGGLASSPYCIIVKTINVEPALASTEAAPGGVPGMPGGGGMPPAVPVVPGGKGMTAYLNEHQLRVTLNVVVVKLKPQK